MTDPDRLKELQESAQTQLEEVGHGFNEILAAYQPLLVALGAGRIRIEYSGYGDSGEIEAIYVENEAGDEAEVSPWMDVDILRDVAYEVLPGGWEINEGSSGSIVIDLLKRSVQLNQSWSTEDEEAEPFSVPLDPK